MEFAYQFIVFGACLFIFIIVRSFIFSAVLIHSCVTMIDLLKICDRDSVDDIDDHSYLLQL